MTFLSALGAAWIGLVVVNHWREIGAMLMFAVLGLIPLGALLGLWVLFCHITGFSL